MENLTIKEIATIVGSLVALIGGIEFLALRMRKYIKNTMKSEIDPLKKELTINTLNTMKNTICNDCIPLSERVSVGKAYIEKGGNGAVKVLVHTLEEKYEKELEENNK